VAGVVSSVVVLLLLSHALASHARVMTATTARTRRALLRFISRLYADDGDRPAGVR
jgi:hypothetical protein